jgi:hypothetical protein
VRALVERLPEPEAVPILVFDAGYDPVKLQRGLEGSPARILVRLHSNRVFYADPEPFFPTAGRTPAPPRQEVRPNGGARDLDGAFGRAPLRKRRLRLGA